MIYPKHEVVASIDGAEEIVERMSQRPDIVHGGDRAFYCPSEDRIHMPAKDTFSSAENYFATLYHEIGHASGHEKRLSRKGVTSGAAFASHEYYPDSVFILSKLIDPRLILQNGDATLQIKNPSWVNHCTNRVATLT
jgi:antirestriction protein ArdC